MSFEQAFNTVYIGGIILVLVILLIAYPSARAFKKKKKQI